MVFCSIGCFNRTNRVNRKNFQNFSGEHMRLGRRQPAKKKKISTRKRTGGLVAAAIHHPLPAIAAIGRSLRPSVVVAWAASPIHPMRPPTNPNASQWASLLPALPTLPPLTHSHCRHCRMPTTRAGGGGIGVEGCIGGDIVHWISSA